MVTAFPETAIINVPADIARRLLAAAERLPAYQNKDFYSTEIQSLVFVSIRSECRAGMDWLVSRIQERLAQRPYCVLIRGLRFDEGNRLFVAINRAFGELVALPYQEPRAQLVHYIEPRTDKLSKRGGRETERLHTDAADWGTPIGFISMLCIRADEHGYGRSRLLDVDAIRDEVQLKLGTDKLELLKTHAVPWQLHDCWGGGLKWRTVLTDSTICWRGYTIHLAVDENGAAVSREMLTLLDDFENVIEHSPHTIDFFLHERELLFSDNMRSVHARTPIMDAEVSNRLMLRSWIKTA